MVEGVGDLLQVVEEVLEEVVGPPCLEGEEVEAAPLLQEVAEEEEAVADLTLEAAGEVELRPLA